MVGRAQRRGGCRPDSQRPAKLPDPVPRPEIWAARSNHTRQREVWRLNREAGYSNIPTYTFDYTLPKSYNPPMDHPHYYAGYPHYQDVYTGFPAPSYVPGPYWTYPVPPYSPYPFSAQPQSGFFPPPYACSNPPQAPAHSYSQMAQTGWSLNGYFERSQQGRRRQKGTRGSPSVSDGYFTRRQQHNVSAEATRSLYVGHIHPDATLLDLRYFFGRHGQVIECVLSEGEGLKYGFVVFDTINAAKSAVEKLHNCNNPELTDAKHPDSTKRSLVVRFQGEMRGHGREKHVNQEQCLGQASMQHGVDGAGGHQSNVSSSSHNAEPITPRQPGGDAHSAESLFQATTDETNLGDTADAPATSSSLLQEPCTPTSTTSNDSMDSWQLAGCDKAVTRRRDELQASNEPRGKSKKPRRRVILTISLPVLRL